jgi:hypothetical protein
MKHTLIFIDTFISNNKTMNDLYRLLYLNIKQREIIEVLNELEDNRRQLEYLKKLNYKLRFRSH